MQQSTFARAFIVLTVWLVAAPLSAQTPTSTTQMQLVSSATFTQRLQYLGVQVMKEVLEEAQTFAGSAPIPAYTAGCHTLRTEYAKRFLLSPASFAAQSGVLIVGANFSGAVLVGTVVNREVDPQRPPIWDSSATDGAIQQAYRVLMNTFAGCVINP